MRTMLNSPAAVGRALEVAASLAALALAAAVARRYGLDRTGVELLLVAAAPLVGEFAATMAYRYRSGMSVAEAGARLLRNSSCDACGIALTQFDILPVVPYLARRGRCSCRAFAVPATCTLAGLASLAVTAAIVAGCRAAGTDPVAPAVLFLAFVPALAGDLAHGEVDGWLLLPPVLLCGPFLHAPWWTGPAMALLLGGNILCSGLMARLFGAASLLAFGIPDVVAAAAGGLYMGMQDAVSATVWLLPAGAASFAAIRVPAVRRLLPAGRFGSEEEAADRPAGAVPFFPAVVASLVLGLAWHVA